jgi:DNA-binding XRE family transcriptional regulator
VSEDTDEALRFPDRLRAFAAKDLIRYPYLIALGSEVLPPNFGAKCIELDMGFILRESTKQIHATVKAIYWRLRTKKRRVTIRVEYIRGRYVFHLCGANGSNEMRLGVQLGKLLLMLARGGHFYTVETLADELGISKQSVKKYMKALRVAFDSAKEGLLISETSEDVFCMERRVGGTICELRANVV